MTTPSWASSIPASASVNTDPNPAKKTIQMPFSWQQLVELVGAAGEMMVGKVAVALGGISIAGWDPLGFLTDWGKGLERQAQNAFDKATAAHAVASAATTTLAQQSSAKPGWVAGDATADATFPIATWQALSTATYLSATQADSVMGFIGTPDNGDKLSIVWLGKSTTNITGFYINTYLLDVATGQGTMVEASANIIADVPNTLSYNYYTLATPISTAVGNIYACEIVVEGTGSYQVAGLTNITAPSNPTTYPHSQGAYRAPVGVSFDADANSLNRFPNATSYSDSFTHTATAGAAVVLALSWRLSSGSYTTPTATYNGVAMTLLGIVGNTNSHVALFGMLGVPGGAQTVAYSIPAGGMISFALAATASYTGALSFGTVTTNSGSSATPSTGAVASAVGQMVVAGLSAGSTSTSLTESGFTGTDRFDNAITDVAGTLAFQFGDSAGAGAVTQSGTLSASTPWVAVAVPLIPALEPAPTNLLVSEVNYSANVPWFALAGYTEQTPVPAAHNVAGTYTYTLPSWMAWGDKIDVALVGGGGGGQAAKLLGVLQGGKEGAWLVATLTFGVDIPQTTTTLTITVGAGGDGGLGVAGQPGKRGGDTTLTGTGVTTLTASGGLGGNGLSPRTGYGPGNTTLSGITYTGGVNVGAEASGSAPGGGSGAASPLMAAKDGADGAAWITAYQAGTTP